MILEGVGMVFQTRHRPVHALDNINLTVSRRSFVSLVGQSGCGKTTLLRIISGLVAPTQGRVLVDGLSLWDGATRQNATQAHLGVVFQDPNLFPWYTIEQNIALPLTLQRVSRSQRRERARELCALVGLEGFERAYPRELSGGMRQRAAIARALSYNPELLLLDEPFGALDALTRDKMNVELQRIVRQTNATVMLVTHSIGEAVFLSDRIVLLSPRPGRIHSVTDVPFGRPRDLDIQSEPAFQEIVRDLRHQLTDPGQAGSVL